MGVHILRGCAPNLLDGSSASGSWALGASTSGVLVHWYIGTLVHCHIGSWGASQLETVVGAHLGGVALCTLHYALCTRHYALGTMHHALRTMRDWIIS